MPTVLKYGSLNLLEPSGPVQACNGTAFLLFRYKRRKDTVSVLLFVIVRGTEHARSHLRITNTDVTTKPKGETGCCACLSLPLSSPFSSTLSVFNNSQRRSWECGSKFGYRIYHQTMITLCPTDSTLIPEWKGAEPLPEALRNIQHWPKPVETVTPKTMTLSRDLSVWNLLPHPMSRAAIAQSV